jgi:hypothetical protein
MTGSAGRCLSVPPAIPNRCHIRATLGGIRFVDIFAQCLLPTPSASRYSICESFNNWGEIYLKHKTHVSPIPLALLIHHSGYFLRLRNFQEGEKAAVVLLDFEPDVFRFFIELMYYGRYSFVDNLNYQNRVRDNAKA